MSALPFSVSLEAAEMIAESLRSGDTAPGCAGLLPALGHCFDYTRADSSGRVTEHFPDEFWEIGWYKPATAAGSDFMTIQIGGRPILIHSNDLGRLTGKRLVVETVNVGVPHPADRTRKLLRAV